MRKGFTLPEIIVAMALVVSLLSLGIINFLSISRSADLVSARNILVADLREQQLSAMNGVSSGISFNGDNYVFIPDNFMVELKNITISTAFSGGVINFEAGSGEVVSFVEGQNTITLIDNTNGNTEVVTLNTFGVPI